MSAPSAVREPETVFLSARERQALAIRHGAAMRVVRDCNSEDERLSLLAAVIAPSSRALREM